jgi:uncharacterized membrane protein
MKSVEESIHVKASATVAFREWRNFENFPSFMEGVDSIERLEGPFFLLRSENAGIHYESLCEIILEIPDRRIAWRTLSGASSMGVVRFEFQSGPSTLITLVMHYEPEDGWQSHEQVVTRLRTNLRRFKDLVERIQKPALA